MTGGARRILVGMALGAALLALGPPQSAAQERILRYDSEVEILADGTLEVTEHITVRAEGRSIRRGIYRDFPTRYRDRYGNRVRVDFRMLYVERNGQTEEWFTERLSNGVRINTGGDAFLPVPAEYTFTLRYRTTRQLGFFDEHDELYWNAIGTGWAFPIEAGEVEVRLPEAVPVEALHVEGYTGRQGAQGIDYEAEVPEAGVARYRLTEGLDAREGLTIVLTFPKGIVDEPTTVQRAGWFLSDNRGVLVALLGFVGLLVFCVRRWQTVGRDPPSGVIIPRYRPPEGHGPAGLRYLSRMRYDSRCFSSDLLGLAVAGELEIGSRKKMIGDEWWLERGPGWREAYAGEIPSGDATANAPGELPGGGTAAARAALHPNQHTLVRMLFPRGTGRVDLESKSHETVSAAQKAHKKALDREFHPEYFKRNAGTAGAAMAIAVAAAGLGLAVAGGNGIPAIFVLAFLMVATAGVFGTMVRARTPQGRRLLDEIEGLKLYLSVAERDELARMPGPEEPPIVDAERYEALLPFAVALEVEDAWTSKFTAAVGAAAAAQAGSRMTWYSGHVPVTNLSGFTRAMGSGLSSQVASASSPPGSGSGAGGGGSAGGGGGGGGGGGR